MSINILAFYDDFHSILHAHVNLSKSSQRNILCFILFFSFYYICIIHHLNSGTHDATTSTQFKTKQIQFLYKITSSTIKKCTIKQSQ